LSLNLIDLVVFWYEYGGCDAWPINREFLGDDRTIFRVGIFHILDTMIWSGSDLTWSRFDCGRFDLGPILFGADLTCYLFKHVFEVLDGGNHLDTCILKLFSLAFQDDMFLFYLLLVYLNNCRTNLYYVPFVFVSYFTNFLTWYFCSPPKTKQMTTSTCASKFNLSKTIHFLKRPWFPYVLSKYQAIFKVLQWNARLWKIPTQSELNSCKWRCFR
jgi:hypothetical protein